MTRAEAEGHWERVTTVYDATGHDVDVSPALKRLSDALRLLAEDMRPASSDSMDGLVGEIVDGLVAQRLQWWAMTGR